jgi:copper chaperone CopZ
VYSDRLSRVDIIGSENMQKFKVTMMCANCKNRISEALQRYGFKNFDIDMGTSILSFHETVDPDLVIRAVNSIDYKIEKVDEIEDLSADDINRILMENEKAKYQND